MGSQGRFCTPPQLVTNLLREFIDEMGGDVRFEVTDVTVQNEMETLQPGPGSEFLIARLMELILVEMLRRETPKVDDHSTGLIAGLFDPAIARAAGHAWRDCARVERGRAGASVRRVAVGVCDTFQGSDGRRAD
jgi:hypothetical protein